MNAVTMRDIIKRNVREVDPAAEVWLYGSRVRGSAGKDSDWDVLVLSAKKKVSFADEEKFMDHICDVIVSTGQFVHLFVYGKEDWYTNHSMTPFYQSVTSEAVLL